MDYIDSHLENEIIIFFRTVSKNVQRKRIKEGKTVEDIAYDALNHNSTSFYNSAENLKNGKHFNMRQLFLIAKYYDCDIREFINEEIR